LNGLKAEDAAGFNTVLINNPRSLTVAVPCYFTATDCFACDYGGTVGPAAIGKNVCEARWKAYCGPGPVPT